MSNLKSGLVTTALLAAVAAANAGDASLTLKSAFKGHFMVGAALNQRQFTERDTNGAALVTRQFNSISPENAEAKNASTTK